MNLRKMPPKPAQLTATVYEPALNQQYKINLLSSYLTKSRNFKFSKVKCLSQSIAARNDLHGELPECIHLVHSTTSRLSQNIREEPLKKKL